MARVKFTQNLQRHVTCPVAEASGATVREVLEAVFSANPQARGYVLDEHGEVRRHMIVFVDGRPIRDRAGLSDPVGEASEIYVMQALSGGNRAAKAEGRAHRGREEPR
jgi:molybdopterin converting factor small subunit